MKMKALRQHYQTTDNGVTWIPKVKFENQIAVDKHFEENGFYPSQWTVYLCNFCSNLHIATVRTKQ